jgi:alpha-N-arabinofuranosidase
MKRVFLAIVLAVTFSTAGAQNAKIKIDLDRTIGTIDPNIYGNFVEHLGRCVYGGIYEPGSPLSDADGFRKDVLEAVKGLNVSLVRYPGGNFVSNYNWLDAVGPVRKPRMDYAWNRLETNLFGTNEFAKWCKTVGTEPFMCVNLGTGTIQEAQAWVEYSNANSGSYYSNLRKEHGFSEPHKIKYWALGNEMDGEWQMGHLNAEDYVKKAREATKLMRLVDPSIKVIAAGSSNYGRDANPYHWNRTILEGLYPNIDYIALHMYVGNRENNYYNFVAEPMLMDSRTQVVRGMINEQQQRTNKRTPVYIAWTEYNVWYRGNSALEERYNLEDALVVAGFLNVFVRNCDIVKMANMAQLVNVIAPIFTNEKGLFLQTIYYPLQLFAQHVKGTALDVFVDSPKHNFGQAGAAPSQRPAPRREIPYLDVSASINGNEIVICVVNRNKDNAIATDIIAQEGSFAGNFEVYEVNGPDIKAENDFDKTTVKTTKKADIRASGQKITYSFAPHSFTMLKGKINR